MALIAGLIVVFLLLGVAGLGELFVTLFFGILLLLAIISFFIFGFLFKWLILLLIIVGLYKLIKKFAAGDH